MMKHVSHVENVINACKIIIRNLKRRDQSRNLDVYRRIILKNTNVSFPPRTFVYQLY